MNIFHPGGNELTDELAALCGWEPGARILDVGCGEGYALTRLREKGFSPVGCDTDKELLRRAKARDSQLRVRVTDGVCLDFPSLYFDGAMLECSFSLMERHEELLHELYCVLRPGAVLGISDLFLLDPDPERVRAHRQWAYSVLNRPRVNEGECESSEFPSPVLLDGVFLLDELRALIEETGFTLLTVQDRTQELRDWCAQTLMDYGSFEAMWDACLPEGAERGRFCRESYPKNCGYFLLAARKEER